MFLFLPEDGVEDVHGAGGVGVGFRGGGGGFALAFAAAGAVAAVVGDGPGLLEELAEPPGGHGDFAVAVKGWVAGGVGFPEFGGGHWSAARDPLFFNASKPEGIGLPKSA